MKRQPGTSVRQLANGALAASLMLTLASSFATAGPASAAEVDQLADAVIDAMAELPRPGFELEFWINGNDAAVLAVGSDVVFHLRSDRVTHVTLVYLDQDAIISLPIPSQIVDAGLVAEPGRPHVISCEGIVPGTAPEPDCGFEASLPLGFDVIWAIATPEPLPVRELGGPWNIDEGLERLRAQDGPAFAKALVAHLKQLPAEAVSWLRVEQAVLELGEGNPELLSAYVRERSARGSRSAQRYRMPSIFFASRSASLDARAKRSLEVVAKAMQRPEYASARIRLIGHADAVGTAEANQKLSRERAEAARRQLVAAGLDASRIEVAAQGESQPLSPESDASAYQRNRRVELDIQP